MKLLLFGFPVIICMLVSGIVALYRQHNYGDTLHSVATFLCGTGFGVFSLCLFYKPFLQIDSMLAEATENGETVWGGGLIFMIPLIFICWLVGAFISIPILICTCKTVEAIGYDEEEVKTKILWMIVCLITQIVLSGAILFMF